MERLTQNLLLVLLGGITLRVALTDAHLAYVQAGFRPFLIFAGAVLLVLGSIGTVRDWPLRQSDHEAEPDDPAPGASGHVDHGHGPPRIGLFLVLPVAVLLLIAPPALGAYTADRQAQAIAIPESLQNSALRLGPDDDGADYRSMPLLEYAMYALADDTFTLEDRSVRLQGFVLPRPDGGWSVARIRISCCAADAVPVTVVVDGDRGPLQADQWVEIIGTWAPPVAHPDGDYPEPVIVPRSVTPIPPPASPYEG
ncbi:TIGR03943 family putative permease subunit [Blastococcus saxobsidens]|uniref:Putative repeat protein (TIGR03943 family) n=1 Tax=Blastococcus saxobsidens TaxID=138336 RepID=A0A4Q7YAU5_9ACTN|nr:TIGR03943 family protein [Blastococcus saxobsidens]RZU33533.1 putative repeat protein (TIGR03943 family) [Blastococcus saxobsidens]